MQEHQQNRDVKNKAASLFCFISPHQVDMTLLSLVQLVSNRWNDHNKGGTLFVDDFFIFGKVCPRSRFLILPFFGFAVFVGIFYFAIPSCSTVRRVKGSRCMI